MNEVFRRSIKFDDDSKTVFDKDILLDKEGLFDIQKLLPDNLKKRFMKGYLRLRFSAFWDDLKISVDKEAEKLCVKIEPPLAKYRKVENNILNTTKEMELLLSPEFDPYRDDFLKELLNDFCLSLGVVFFTLRPNQVLLDFYYFGVDIWQKKHFLTSKKIVEIILNNYFYVTIDILHNSSDQIMKFLESIEPMDANEAFKAKKEFIEKTPSCFKLKQYLIDNKLIREDFLITPGISLQKVKFEISNYYKNYYLKAKCPICGKEYVKNRKDKTTCGDSKCKILKNRFKKEILKIKNYKNLSPNAFLDQITEIDNQRINTNKTKRKNYQNIADLKKLSEILFNETR